MRKIVSFFKIYWSKILLIGVLGAISGVILMLLLAGFWNFSAMELFSRKQMMAMLGIYLLVGILQAFIFVGLMQVGQYYFMSGSFLNQIGKDKISLAKTSVKWADVIGMDNAKKEAWELVKLLKDRSMVKAIGGKIIKGTLMIGPPGCGKTYLAKAISTECGLPMLSAVGSDFVGIFVGQGAAQMKSLFRQARTMAGIHGGCIIFIDEIDSFARPRMADMGFGGGISHNATINQFLTEMDGLRQAENNIVVIAATNVSEHELDPALTRAGRFDRKIYVTNPNLEERKQLFQFYLSRVQTQADIDTDLLARKALGFSPSDIANMVREAGIMALREKRVSLLTKDLSAAYDRVMFGMKSNIVLTKEEKVWTAYHEAGHAVIAYLTHPTNDVIKATIIPYKGSLGFISQRPVEELHSANKDHLLANIKVSLASYVAETLKFGKTSSGVGGGANSDFGNAMRIAQTMVWRYGMGKSGLIGDFYMMTTGDGQPLISEKTKETLDQDVQDILQNCLKEIHEILAQHRETLEYFAQELLKKEELEYDEIVAIFDRQGLKPASRSPATQ